MSLDVLILIGALLALAAVLGTRLTQGFGVPTLVIFVGIGMLAGGAGPGGIAFDDVGLAFDVGVLALAVILFSGGVDADAKLLRPAVMPALLLSTVGVAVAAGSLGLLAWWLTPLELVPALILGAVMAPTDAAAVFSVLQGRGVPDRLKAILEAESGTNDPVAIYLVLATTALATGSTGGAGAVLLGMATQLALGGLVGVAAGFVLTTLLNRMRVTSFGLLPIAALAGGLAAFA
ncbi:MAG: cation:proton antiporter, partial [Trueperaceae bacterium]